MSTSQAHGGDMLVGLRTDWRVGKSPRVSLSSPLPRSISNDPLEYGPWTPSPASLYRPHYQRPNLEYGLSMLYVIEIQRILRLSFRTGFGIVTVDDAQYLPGQKECLTTQNITYVSLLTSI